MTMLMRFANIVNLGKWTLANLFKGESQSSSSHNDMLTGC